MRYGGLANPFVGFGALIVAVAFLGYVAVGPAGNERPEVQQTVVAAAERVGDGGSVAMADLLPFQWDRMYVFGSYTTPNAMNDALGFDWSPLSPLDTVISAGAVMPNDGLFLLVFVQGDNQVTGWVELNANGDPPFVEFDDSAGSGAISRASAIFTVQDASSWMFEGQYEAWELNLVRNR
jgi:hypothetical protein